MDGEMDKGQLIMGLMDRMKEVTPLPEEEGFFTSTETLVRFLKARDWKLDEAEKLLREAVEWRRSTRPMHLDCRWCNERPGYHALRQVGFDECGRPVMYSCFAQAAVQRNTVEDSVTHSTYLIENAKKTMPLGVSTWVFVMDCTGITLPACNPRLGYGATQIMSNHYPERLGLVICVNHNAIFQGVWRAIKAFLHPSTTAKMQLVRSKKKINESFSKYFSDELSNWLLEEMALNKQKPLPSSQREFWKVPSIGTTHDPRGCKSYVDKYVETWESSASTTDTHKPHPNIIGTASEKSIKIPTPPLDARGASACEENGEDSSDIEDNDVDDIDFADEFKIPQNATEVQG